MAFDTASLTDQTRTDASISPRGWSRDQGDLLIVHVEAPALEDALGYLLHVDADRVLRHGRDGKARIMGRGAVIQLAAVRERDSGACRPRAWW